MAGSKRPAKIASAKSAAQTPARVREVVTTSPDAGLGVIGRKVGMTQVFQEDGSVARVTVLQAGPCPVTGVRTSERDGYDALQLAFGETKPKHLT